MEQIPEKENIWNIPNFLTLSRIIITFIIVYLVFTGFDMIFIVVLFVIGMLTDFFDGFIARRYNLKTEFGRKFDMTADRVIIVGTAFAFIIKFNTDGLLVDIHYFQIIFMLIRELLTTPIALITMIMGGGVPQVRFIGKMTTFMQSVSFPLVFLSVFYPVFSFSIYFAIFTGILGLASSCYYINDMRNLLIAIKK